MPEASVRAVRLSRIDVAPLEGTVNTTLAPFTCRARESSTCTRKGAANPEPGSVDCELPASAVIVAGAPYAAAPPTWKVFVTVLPAMVASKVQVPGRFGKAG